MCGKQAAQQPYRWGIMFYDVFSALNVNRLFWTHTLCRPSWSPSAHPCCVSTKSQSAFLHLFPNPGKDTSLHYFFFVHKTLSDTHTFHLDLDAAKSNSVFWPVEGSVSLQYNPATQSAQFYLDASSDLWGVVLGRALHQTEDHWFQRARQRCLQGCDHVLKTQPR